MNDGGLMKERQPRTIRVYLLETLLLAAADFLIIFLFVIFLSDILRDIVGLDFVMYEDYYGLLENQTQLRFGAGCWQYTFELVKTVLFIVLQVKLNKKYKESVIRLVVPILLHAVLLGVGLFIVTKGGYGWLALEMFRQLFAGEA